MCGGQRTAFWSWFSTSTFMWVLRIGLRSPGKGHYLLNKHQFFFSSMADVLTSNLSKLLFQWNSILRTVNSSPTLLRRAWRSEGPWALHLDNCANIGLFKDVTFDKLFWEYFRLLIVLFSWSWKWFWEGGGDEEETTAFDSMPRYPIIILSLNR